MFNRVTLSRSLALAAVLVLPATASAGWITIKNETTQTVVIQETVTVNGTVRRCKPLKLVPGEVFREFHPAAGRKLIHVLEHGLILNRPLCQGELKWQDADQGFSVFRVAEGVKVMTAEDAVAAVQAAATPTARAQAPDTVPPVMPPPAPPKDDRKPR